MPDSPMKKALFLDKDGTLVHDVPYNTDPAKVRFYPDVIPTLQRLQGAGYELVIVTNQSGIARGYCTEADVLWMLAVIETEFEENGLKLLDRYYCPHHPESTVPEYRAICSCRKPKPGMLTSAAAEHDIDLSASWMIGDILNDVEAGNRAGCNSILINNGNETEWKDGPYRRPTATVHAFHELLPVLLDDYEQHVSPYRNHFS